VKLLRTVFANRDLARVELAWAASCLGNWAFSILIVLYAYREDGTGAVAAALVARMVPAGIAAPYAAMLADRLSRQRILLWSSIARAVSLAGVAIAAGAHAPLAVVLVCSAAFTIANTAHRPAQAALLAQVARTPAELAAANAVWSGIDYAGFLVGGLLVGALVSAAGYGVAFGACAATLVLTAYFVLGVAADARPDAPEEPVGIRTELLEGLRTVRGHPEIRLLVVVYAVSMLTMGMFDVLVIVAAVDLLGLGESGGGWLNAAWGGGGVIGGAAALVLMSRGRLASGLTAGLITAGLAFVLIGVWPETVPAFAALIVLGVGFAVIEAALLTLTQRLAADDVAARVFGVQESIDVFAVALGSVLTAVLVDALDIRGAIVVAGAIMPVVAVLIARRVARWEAGTEVPEREFGLVRALTIFEQLPIATLENLALRLTERRFAAGAEILKQGDVGDEFFIIADGEVEMLVDGVVRGREGVSSFFGEIALLRDVPRTATVCAAGDVTVLAIEREHFLAAIGGHARSAGAAEAIARDRLAANAAPSQV
jgi:predicted MFS family arabinose efflux permease